MSKKGLTYKQKKFVQEYCYDWNATRAYMVAYPTVKNKDTAAAAASRMLSNVKVKEHIEEVQSDIEKQCGISRMMVVNKLKEQAFTSIAHLHNTWIERKDFDQLTETEKSCIQEISTKISKIPIGESGVTKEVEFIKVKLYDSQKALEMLSKMLGYNEPEKIDHTTDGNPIVINLGSGEKPDE
jgi:phage terminase small subunit